MPQFRKLDLERLLGQVRYSAGAPWIQHLATLGLSDCRLAHFGCAGGAQTLALMWVLDASEAWGIDRSIDQARKTMCNARQWVCESILALPYESQAALTWWEDQVPLFLKQKRFPVMVKERDIAHPIRPYQLPDRYFDLACCSHLLYHILGEQGKEAVVSAVREMIRVTKPGGWIVVDEPDEGVVQRYREFLEQAGLDVCRVDVDETVIQAGEKLTASTYYCQFRGR